MPSDPIPAPLLMTVRETAKALSICEKSLWTLRRSGRLRAVCIGRAVRYDLADVRRFVEGAKSGGRP